MITVTKIIKNPRITEKASAGYEKGMYSFEVSDSASKAEIKKAIFEIYKVRPVKVNILPIPEKKVFSKGKKGKKSGGKKAVVYLKEGDKIELI